MTPTDALNARLRAADAMIATHGWTQGEDRDETTGAVCMQGAVMLCQPRTGDEQLIAQVMSRRQTWVDFNDRHGRDAAEVRAALAVEVTDAELAATFGAQWPEIVALVRRTATLTAPEAARLAVTAATGAERVAARVAAWGAVRDAEERVAERDAARRAVWGAARRAAWGAARGAAWDAGRALAVRDLITEDGFTQQHYDVLTLPWRTVIGPLHPEDVAL